MTKRILFILCFISAVILVKEWHYLFTGGFKVNKIICNHPHNYKWDIAVLNGPQEKTIQKILEQDFCYLGKGRQAYVFESADKKWVLKFVRFHRYRLPFWLDNGLFSFFREWVENSKGRRFLRAMNSYKIAYEKMQEETKVFFVHLNKSENVHKNVLLKCGGRDFVVNLDHTIFFLQRKVPTLKEHFAILRKNGDLSGVKEVVCSFLKGIKNRAEKGIMNRDFLNAIRNWGYFEGQIVEMDLGGFCEAPHLKENKASLKEEFVRCSLPLREYVSDKFPELLPFFEEELSRNKEAL